MRAAFHTLGCKVNQYETESLITAFRDRGYEIVDDHSVADVYVINTCTVTGLADRKSRQNIRRMKRLNPDSIVAVTGCYVQVKPEEVLAVNGVDIVTGINEKKQLPDYVNDFLKDKVKQQHILGYEELDTYEETGALPTTESRTRAFIKVQEGCDRFCSYCIIPYARGPVRSRAAADVVREAKLLIESGFKEIVLTGINTALYGTEQQSGDNAGLEGLIKEIDRLPGDFRIRLSSLEPTVVNKDDIQRFFGYKKLCHHLHLSLQSGSDRILKEMNRSYTRSAYMEIVTALRAFDPDYGITTDIIAGFPGETEEDVKESLEMIQDVGFCKVHVFPYSKRPMTKAAELPEQLPRVVKKERCTALITASVEAADGFFKKCEGQVQRVLVEEYLADIACLTGYTDHYIKVYVRSYDNEVNRFIDVVLEEPFREGMWASFA